MALCAGVGGFELGLKLALGDDYRCVVYVEREAYAAACLVARMEDATLDRAPVWDDVQTFRGEPWRGVVDLVSAGFPCQPHSTAGKRRHTEDERWLWPDIARIIRDVEPEWLFLENVPPLVRGGIDHVLRDLAVCGFDAEWDVFSAAQVGAPHLRERLFILAHAQADGRNERSAAAGSGLSDERGLGGQLARCGSNVLADAGCDRLGGLESESVARSKHAAGPRAGRAVVADTRLRGRGPRDEVLPPRRKQSDPAGRGLTLADTNADGRAFKRRLEVAIEGQVPLGDYADGRRGAPVGDADCQRQQEPGQSLAAIEESRPGSAERPGPGRSALPLFPPTRADFEHWIEVIANEPGLEPAVRRVVAGATRWNDRLRVAGNGVVPLAAAVAFLRLRARLTGKETYVA